MKNNPKIEYSSILKEIIRFRLPLFLRWGSVWILLLLALFFSSLSFISFPVTETGTFVLVPTKETGNCYLPEDAVVTEIPFSAYDWVRKHEILCSFNTTASVSGILDLEQWADSAIRNPNAIQLPETNSIRDLGELSETFLVTRIAVLSDTDKLSQQKEIEKLRLKILEWKKQHCLLATHSGKWLPVHTSGHQLIGFYLSGKQQYRATVTFQGKRTNLIHIPFNVELQYQGRIIRSRLQNISTHPKSGIIKGTTEIIILNEPVITGSRKGLATIDLGKLSLFKQFFN